MTSFVPVESKQKLCPRGLRREIGTPVVFVPIVSEAERASDTSSYTWSRLRFAIFLRPAVLHARTKNRPTSRLPALFNRRLASAP
jgi:hypothetical protein